MKSVIAAIILSLALCSYGQTTKSTAPTTQVGTDYPALRKRLAFLEKENAELKKEAEKNSALIKDLYRAVDDWRDKFLKIQAKYVPDANKPWKLEIGASREGLLAHAKENQMYLSSETEDNEYYRAFTFTCVVSKATQKITSIDYY